MLMKVLLKQCKGQQGYVTFATRQFRSKKTYIYLSGQPQTNGQKVKSNTQKRHANETQHSPNQQAIEEIKKSLFFHFEMSATWTFLLSCFFSFFD